MTGLMVESPRKTAAPSSPKPLDSSSSPNRHTLESSPREQLGELFRENSDDSCHGSPGRASRKRTSHAADAAAAAAHGSLPKPLPLPPGMTISQLPGLLKPVVKRDRVMSVASGIDKTLKKEKDHIEEKARLPGARASERRVTWHEGSAAQLGKVPHQAGDDRQPKASATDPPLSIAAASSQPDSIPTAPAASSAHDGEIDSDGADFQDLDRESEGADFQDPQVSLVEVPAATLPKNAGSEGVDDGCSTEVAITAGSPLPKDGADAVSRVAMRGDAVDAADHLAMKEDCVDTDNIAIPSCSVDNSDSVAISEEVGAPPHGDPSSGAAVPEDVGNFSSGSAMPEEVVVAASGAAVPERVADAGSSVPLSPDTAASLPKVPGTPALEQAVDADNFEDLNVNSSVERPSMQFTPAAKPPSLPRPSIQTSAQDAADFIGTANLQTSTDFIGTVDLPSTQADGDEDVEEAPVKESMSPTKAASFLQFSEDSMRAENLSPVEVDDRLASALHKLLPDIDTLLTECDELFYATKGRAADVRMTHEELYEVTQSLIDRFGSRDAAMLDRIGLIYTTMEQAFDESSGMGILEFRGYVASVLTQILRELESRSEARAEADLAASNDAVQNSLDRPIEALTGMLGRLSTATTEIARAMVGLAPEANDPPDVAPASSDGTVDAPALPEG